MYLKTRDDVGGGCGGNSLIQRMESKNGDTRDARAHARACIRRIREEVPHPPPAGDRGRVTGGAECRAIARFRGAGWREPTGRFAVAPGAQDRRRRHCRRAGACPHSRSRDHGAGAPGRTAEGAWRPSPQSGFWPLVAFCQGSATVRFGRRVRPSGLGSNGVAFAACARTDCLGVALAG